MNLHVHHFFFVTADPTALADKVNAVKKYIADITKVAEVSVQSLSETKMLIPLASLKVLQT